MHIMFSTNIDERLINRQENVSVRTIKSKNPAKCAICGLKIDKNNKLVRINPNGHEYRGISICLDCIKYVNELVINESESSIDKNK